MESMWHPVPPPPRKWTVYGLDEAWAGESYVAGCMYNSVAISVPGPGNPHLSYCDDKAGLRYGPMHDPSQPGVDVTSGPVGSLSVIRAMHDGLGRAGLDFGYTGTDHIAGTLRSPQRSTVQVGATAQPMDWWAQNDIEVGFVETDTTWIALTAKGFPINRFGLVPIDDLTPFKLALDDFHRRMSRGEG
jgi:hypothetical protein